MQNCCDWPQPSDLTSLWQVERRACASPHGWARSAPTDAAVPSVVGMLTCRAAATEAVAARAHRTSTEPAAARPGHHGRTHRPRPRAGPARDLRPPRPRVHPDPLRELDALLVTDASLGISRLRWLSTGPARRSAGDRHRPALAQAKPRLPRDHGVPDTGRCGCATLFSDQLSSPMARKRLTEAVAVP